MFPLQDANLKESFVERRQHYCVQSICETVTTTCMGKTVLINTLVRLQQTIEIMTINGEIFFSLCWPKK